MKIHKIKWEPVGGAANTPFEHFIPPLPCIHSIAVNKTSEISVIKKIEI